MLQNLKKRSAMNGCSPLHLLQIFSAVSPYIAYISFQYVESEHAITELADPLKMKARQFSASSVGSRSAPSNLWTETPQERMQRIADEVNGVKRRAVNATEEDKEDKRVAKRRKRAEEEVRAAVDNYNVRLLCSSSLDLHADFTPGHLENNAKQDTSRNALIKTESFCR